MKNITLLGATQKGNNLTKKILFCFLKTTHKNYNIFEYFLFISISALRKNSSILDRYPHWFYLVALVFLYSLANGLEFSIDWSLHKIFLILKFNSVSSLLTIIIHFYLIVYIYKK